MIIPPFFGLGVWTANVKYKACMFSAYDFNSYLYVNVFLNGLALVPAIGLNVTCYYCILKKVRSVSTINKCFCYGSVSPYILMDDM